MFDQWIGKPFWIVLGSLAGSFLLSIIVFHNPGQLIALVFIGLLVLILTLWRLELGIFAVFIELFANSHGHLISAELGGFNLSLRMVIFLAVMLGWLILLVLRRTKLSIRDTRLMFFWPLFLAVITGLAVGLLQNETAKTFNDSNAYFYLAYVFPVLSVDWEVLKKRILLQILAAAAVWVTFLTLGLLYVFTHFPAWMLSAVYGFIRDTRTGELTRMTNSLFRIFLQAQFSVIILTLLLAPSLFIKEINRRIKLGLLVVFSLVAAVLLISLSRSFWVGILLALLPFVFLLLKTIKPNLKTVLKAGGFSLSSGILGAVILVLIILFPLPYRVGSAGELSGLFSSRASDTDDVAVSSRWNLLPEMWKEIMAAPILGSGFGEEVTFKTDDPRARAISPDGTWTTYSFEWGWLDLWLKMGILGPLAFLWLFVILLKQLWSDKKRPNWLTIGLISSVAMLYATHIFSPYLNHPLGLGLLLFTLPFIEAKPTKIPFPLSSHRPSSSFSSSATTTITAPISKQNI